MSVQINLSDSELQKVAAYAEQTGVSVDTYIKQVLLSFIEQAEEAEDEKYILQGIDDIKQGRYVDGPSFIDSLIAKYENI